MQPLKRQCHSHGAILHDLFDHIPKVCLTEIWWLASSVQDSETQCQVKKKKVWNDIEVH